MIHSFRHKGLRGCLKTAIHAAFKPTMLTLLRILARLNAARAIAAIDLPGYRLHALKGDLAGSYYYCVTNKTI